MPEWDVFLSYDRTDATAVERIAEALRAAGLRVFLDTRAIPLFASISDSVRTALSGSRVLLAYYSRSYGSRVACQEEFTAAFLAGERPFDRLLVVNPELGSGHLIPAQVRDRLLPGHPVTRGALTSLVDAVRDRVAALNGPIGRTFTPDEPPAKFTGRWAELWQLHTALSAGQTVVLHGVAGIGKTALAEEYLRLFGHTYTAVHHDLATAGDGDLVVLDDLSAPVDPPPGVACLQLTRDPRLTGGRTGVELTDLGDHELPLTPALRAVAQGSTALARGLAEQFSGSETSMLDRLHGFRSPLLDLVGDRVIPIVNRLGEPSWDVVRVAGVVDPEPITAVFLADVLAHADGGSRAEWFATTESLLSGLIGAGLAAGSRHGEEFVVPRSFLLAVRRADPRPARADALRAATAAVWAHRSRPQPVPHPSRFRAAIDEDERRAAHKILSELTSRVATRELPDGEGSLRDALTSLHTLIDRTRLIVGNVGPDTMRGSHPTRPGLDTLTSRLRDEILNPFLTHWHTRLSQHHELRPADVGSFDHELAWPLQGQLRADLGKVRAAVAEVAEELALLSGNRLS